MSRQIMRAALAAVVLAAGVQALSVAESSGSACPGQGGGTAGVTNGPGAFEGFGEQSDSGCSTIWKGAGEMAQYVYEDFSGWTLEGDPHEGGLPCGNGGTWKTRYPVVNGEAQRDAGVPVCVGAGPGPVVTSAGVLREVRRIGLPTPQLSVQPVGGKTLVNFETIFSTTADEIRRRITVANIPVDVRIWPSSYTWHFGDDATLTTADGGRPWADGVPMEDFLTHVYEDAGVTVRPRVDVTYAAEFRVRRGAWQSVAGTVTINGSPTSLRIAEGRLVFVGS